MSDVQLRNEAGRILATLPSRETPVAVKLIYARPLTERQHVVLLDEKGQEVITLSSIDALDEASRSVAAAALAARYVMPEIARVLSVRMQLGTRYFEVETDRGPATFAVREPGKNVTWLTEDHVVVRDTMGGRYEVTSLAALDPPSRRRLRTAL